MAIKPPTKEELAELSRLYNKARLLKRKEQALRAFLMEPISKQIEKVQDQVKFEYGKELDDTNIRIKELRRKLYLKGDWDNLEFRYKAQFKGGLF